MGSIQRKNGGVYIVYARNVGVNIARFRRLHASLTFAVPAVRTRPLVLPGAATTKVLRQRPWLMLVVLVVVGDSLSTHVALSTRSFYT